MTEDSLVTFTQMKDGTKEEYGPLVAHLAKGCDG